MEAWLLPLRWWQLESFLRWIFIFIDHIREGTSEVWKVMATRSSERRVTKYKKKCVYKFVTKRLTNTKVDAGRPDHFLLWLFSRLFSLSSFLCFNNFFPSFNRVYARSSSRSSSWRRKSYLQNFFFIHIRAVCWVSKVALVSRKCDTDTHSRTWNIYLLSLFFLYLERPLCSVVDTREQLKNYLCIR